LGGAAWRSSVTSVASRAGPISDLNTDTSVSFHSTARVIYYDEKSSANSALFDA